MGPPMLDLDSLSKNTSVKYKSKEEEATINFEEAGHWIGIAMEEDNFSMFVWCENRDESIQTILFADKYPRHRQKAIKFKVEKNMRVNSKELEIFEYYLTQKGGLIAWIKTDPRLVSELHRRAAKAALKEFRTCTYILKITRERKYCVDQLLLEYKKTNKDFRYLVRNDVKDICVLIKRVSEGNHLPYGHISLGVLGALTPLKTVTRESKEIVEEESSSADDLEKFTSPG